MFTCGDCVFTHAGFQVFIPILMFGKEAVHLILSERMDAVRDAVCTFNPCGIVIQAEINLFQLRIIFQHPKRGTVGS